MKYEVTFGTTVSTDFETFPDEESARTAAREWIKSLLTPGAIRAGESYRMIDRNTFAIRHVAGGHPAVASVSKI